MELHAWNQCLIQGWGISKTDNILRAELHLTPNFWPQLFLHRAAEPITLDEHGQVMTVVEQVTVLPPVMS